MDPVDRPGPNVLVIVLGILALCCCGCLGIVGLGIVRARQILPTVLEESMKRIAGPKFSSTVEPGKGTVEVTIDNSTQVEDCDFYIDKLRVSGEKPVEPLPMHVGTVARGTKKKLTLHFKSKLTGATEVTRYAIHYKSANGTGSENINSEGKD